MQEAAFRRRLATVASLLETPAPVLVWVVGHAGTGKSTLLDKTGAARIQARCQETDATAVAVDDAHRMPMADLQAIINREQFDYVIVAFDPGVSGPFLPVSPRQGMKQHTVTLNFPPFCASPGLTKLLAAIHAVHTAASPESPPRTMDRLLRVDDISQACARELRKLVKPVPTPPCSVVHVWATRAAAARHRAEAQGNSTILWTQAVERRSRNTYEWPTLRPGQPVKHTASKQIQKGLAGHLDKCVDASHLGVDEIVRTGDDDIVLYVHDCVSPPRHVVFGMLHAVKHLSQLRFASFPAFVLGCRQ